MIGELLSDDPRQIGPYMLLGRLGAGGMGRVYLGRSAGGHLVAVKVIRADLAEDADFRARFSQEVAAARTVGGMFTAAVVGFDADGPMPWLATAYVPGPSLAEAVQLHGPLPVVSVLALAAGIAEGLVAVHAARVVHRDLKPANVLLAEDGPRLIDFGISRAAEASSLTRTGLVVGSPGFMSPEQAEGAEVGPPSDVFSLGAVIAFAATGQNPFGTGPTPALVYRVVHGEPDLSGLDEPVRLLAQRCLAKDPLLRPTPEQILAEAGAAQPSAQWLPAGLIADLVQYSPARIPAVIAGANRVPAPPVLPAAIPGRRPLATRRRRAWAWVALAIILAAAAAIVRLHAPPVRSASARSAVSRTAHHVIASGQAPTVSPQATSGSPSQSTSTSTQSAAPRSSEPSTTSSGSPGPAPSTSPPGSVALPGTPDGVSATAAGQYTIDVSWSSGGGKVTGFNVDNGCPPGACALGATLAKTTGPTTSTRFTVTPGTYQCFRVRAVNSSGSSSWSSYGCASTPALTVPGTQEWTDTGVTVAAGDRVGITASGQVYIDPSFPVGPDGDQACTPSVDHPGGPFPAVNLPCWSLVGRIGDGTPFEIGTSILVVASAGRVYLGVNDDNFTDNSGNWTARIKLGGMPPAS